MNRLWPSSSSVRILFILVPVFCESMFDDMCISVVHSLPDSPFSLIPLLTLPNHLRSSSLQPPLYLHFHHRHSSYAMLFSSHHMPVPWIRNDRIMYRGTDSSVVECLTRSLAFPGSNPSLLPFRILGSRNVSDLDLSCNCCLARMLPGEAELVSE